MISAIIIILKAVILVISIDILLLLLIWRVRMINQNFDSREKNKARLKKERKALEDQKKDNLLEEVDHLNDAS